MQLWPKTNFEPKSYHSKMGDPHTRIFEKPLVKEKNIWIIIGQIITIIFAVLWCFTLIGLIWGIPMINGCQQRLKNQRDITITHIVITCIFYSLIPGLFTLIGAIETKKI